jgi:hypothetical protein
MAGTPRPEVADILPGQNREFLLNKTIPHAAGLPHCIPWLQFPGHIFASVRSVSIRG